LNLKPPTKESRTPSLDAFNQETRAALASEKKNGRSGGQLLEIWVSASFRTGLQDAEPLTWEPGKGYTPYGFTLNLRHLKNPIKATIRGLDSKDFHRKS
jgi:hypothetical protein